MTQILYYLIIYHDYFKEQIMLAASLNYFLHEDKNTFNRKPFDAKQSSVMFHTSVSMSCDEMFKNRVVSWCALSTKVLIVVVHYAYSEPHFKRAKVFHKLN